MKQLHAKKRTRDWLKAGLSFILMLSATTAFAQIRQITGIVSDSEGPMIGVSVTVQGTATGVTTDLNGRYSINAAPENTLVFSFVGYADVEEPVGARTAINISMAESATNLDDVVVIGYGTVKRRDLTGSVSSVKEDVILATPSGNVMQALQGRIAGLDYTRSDGKDKMVLRGHRSIAGDNDPLIIIDGVMGGSYTDVNPADIASIDVLKDASSTAIYGSQGANGVIIITTKAPEKGKMSVSYHAYAGWTMWADENTRRVGESWISPRRIAAKNSDQWSSEADDILLFSDVGGNPAYEAFQRGEWTDYRELISRKPFFTNHTLSFTGGSETTSARFTIGWEEEQAKRKGGINDRLNLRAIVDHKVNKWLSAGVNMRLAHNYSKNSPYQSDGGWQLGSPYDANGELIEFPLAEPGTKGGYVNPLLDMRPNYNVKKSHATRISATGYIDIKPIEGLNIRTQLNTNLAFATEGSYVDANSSENIKDQTVPSMATYKMEPSRYLEWNNIVSYEKTIKDHTFGVTALTAWTKKMEEELKGTGTNQNLALNLWYAMAGTKNQTIYTNYSQLQTFSYAARVNYNYKGKYLFTGSWRRDGTSVLSKGHKWTDFPSAALAWRISDEPFMSGTSGWLDNLKLRLSYGVTGNAWIKPYATQSGVTPSSTGLGLQDNGLLHYDYVNSIGNTATKWETSENINLGIDFSVFKGRLDATIELYNTNTRDLLLERKLPSSAGADGMFTIMQNIGKTNNKGIEITLSGYPVRNPNFTWRSTLTFSRNVEKIKELVDGQNITMGSGGTDKEKKTLMIGHPIKSFNTYAYQGIWTSAEEAEAAKYFKDDNMVDSFKPGDYKVFDRNGDFIINENDDYGFLGSTTPDWFAGFDHNFRYRNFDLNIYFFFRWGQWGDNPGANMDPATGGAYTLYDKWFYAEGTNESGAKLPALHASKEAYSYYGYQSAWFCDRSFFKIKNVSLGYTLPQSVLSKANIKNLRIYVSAANPFYLSKSDWMKGRDPEGTLRNYVLGVEFSF